MNVRWRGVALTSRQRDLSMAVLATLAVWLAVNDALEPSDFVSTGVGGALGLLVGAVQLGRRRRPVAVLLISVALVAAYHLAGYSAIGLVFPLLVPYLGAAATGHARPAAALATMLAAGSLSWRIVGEGEGPVPVVVGELQGLVVIGLALALGEASWQRRRYAGEVRERLARAAEDAEREADRRATGQRVAIAGDLHDVLAHHLVVVGLQLRLAEETVAADPAACRAALGAALQAHDEALRETATAVRLLRDNAGAEAAPRSPVPGLADLHGLVPAATAAGLDLDVRVDVVAAVPAATALVAYRICQEALTNTIRHAGAGSATLRVTDADCGIHLSFHDDGAASAPSAPPGRPRSSAGGPQASAGGPRSSAGGPQASAGGPRSSAGGPQASAGQRRSSAERPISPAEPPDLPAGHGLAGMAERAAGVGGRLRCGPARDGGFLVEAWLPGVPS